LADPASELPADTLQQPGGVLITPLINQVEVVQEAGLNLEQIEIGSQRFQPGQLNAAVSSRHKPFQ
jgi:hypothetical protein